MNVLITGGAGFIGSHLAERLLSRGDTVTIIDNLETGQRRNVPADAIFIEGDIAEVDTWYSFTGADVVVHAAASYKDPYNWYGDVRTNVLGTTVLLSAMQDHNISRIVYLQTALCYGLKPLEQPITLNHPLQPWGSSYAVSKTAAENYIRTGGLDFVSFRLANCYGPRNLSGPVPTFYKRLTGGEPCTVMDTRRDFVFVQDLLDVVVKAIDGRGSGFYHVSSGRDVRIADLYYAVCNALHVNAPVTVKHRSPDDVETILLDPSLTEQAFNWHTRKPLADGIRETIEYYSTYGIPGTYTHLRLDTTQERSG